MKIAGSLPRLTRACPWACALLALCAVLPAAAQRWHAAPRGLAPAPTHPLADMAHMSWVRRDGAPSDIAALAQTADGYLWIGSSSGLFRFDGQQFQSYPFSPADPRLPSADINALAADNKGGLWIGYRMGGITYLRDGVKTDYMKQDGMVSESTGELHCRPDGSAWAIADGRLRHFTGSGWENYSLRHGLPSDGLYTLFFDRDGNLWTSDKGHIYEQKHATGSFELVSAPVGAVNQFVQLPNGEIWISDAWKNVRPLHDDQLKRATRIPGVPVMLADNSGDIWMANDFGGITRLRLPGQPGSQPEYFTTANGLTDGQTRALLIDRQGALWIGTARGLDRFRPSPVTPFNGIALDYYPALIADRNNGIWFHDMDKPLMRLQQGKLSFVGQGHGSSTLFQDRDGAVWMLDQITRDFYGYPASGGAPTRIHVPKEGMAGETWCIGKDRSGNLLACFEGHGLWRHAGGEWQHVLDPVLPVESPLSLLTAPSGDIWLGYAHNQIVRNNASGYRLFGQQQGLEINTVFTFYLVDGKLFVGGSDGLAWFDGARFHSFRLRAPGILRGVSGVVKDRFGDLWLNAGPGILRLPHAEWTHGMADARYAMDFQLLNERDGVLGTPAQNKPTPSAVADTSGTLWFATSGHLFALDPATVRGAPATPSVLLQSVVVNGVPRRYVPGEPVVIGPHELKTLEFDYIGVELSAPDRVAYQYLLEGQDKSWQEAGSRHEAFYTNLPPGAYRFHVRAASGTGPWNELVTGSVEIRPRFFQTWWFYALVGLSFAVLLWLVYRLRVQRITARMRERLEERARERIRIARDLHDTLLQGIQGLVLHFHFATERLPQDEPARADLLEALDRADQIIGEGRDKVRALRTDPIAPEHLDKRFQQFVATLGPSPGPSVSVHVHGHPRALRPALQDELFTIGREALSNAMRHARATEISIELFYEPRRFRLLCRDNGRGIDPAVVRDGFRQGHWGIPGMRERARNLGGVLDLASAPGGGTQVEVSLDARKAYLTEMSLPARLWAAFRQSIRPRPEIAEPAPRHAAD